MDAPSSFFFNLERKEGERKQMLHLKLPDGTLTTNPKEMRNHAKNFYSDLFKARHCDINCMEDLLRDLPKITDDQRQLLEADIHLDEISEAVKKLSNGRSPGIDGLPSEFCKQFWTILKDDILDVFRLSQRKNEIPTSCRRAVLSLLPKKDDPGLLKNWRPVALLCTDYKILAKCLANRLKHFLEYVINDFQTYCVPKITIMDNLYLVRDVTNLANAGNEDLGLSIDQEKAFDKVDHFYLFETLKAFGFGENFISWIKLLYTGASALLKVGGGLSYPVFVNRGIRQGCPLSGQLYSLAIEPLLKKLREKLQGFLVEGCGKNRPITLSAYADDITVLIKCDKDVMNLTNALHIYEKASSAKLNWEKSEGYVGGLAGKGPSCASGGS